MMNRESRKRIPPILVQTFFQGFFCLLSSVFCLLLATPALAQGKFTPGLPLEPGKGEQTFQEYFSSLINVGIIVAIAISVLITVYAGILYAQSQGEASKVALAKELVAGCLTGLAILLLIRLILPTLGIEP